MLLSTDPIADMLTRIRNAINVGKNTVRIPYSKQKATIAEQLSANKFIESVEVVGEGRNRDIRIIINAPGTNPRINHIERVSKPGRRAYAKVTDIPRVKNGRGIVIVSTSQGVMTGEQASKQRLGGELICKVY